MELTNSEIKILRETYDDEYVRFLAYLKSQGPVANSVSEKVVNDITLTDSPTRNAITAATTQDINNESSSVRQALNGTIGSVVGTLGGERSSTGFLSLAGTAASVPVVKPSTDTRPGVWEFTHNSSTGYMYHLLTGSSFGAPAALIAMGLDNGTGGSGLLVANKKRSVGITLRQQATIDDAGAYALKVDGLSTVAPSIRIEQNVNGAADAMQLLAFGTPTATQNLLLVSAGGGNAGFIRALNGDIDWRRNITVRDKDGSTVSAFMAGENSAYATWGDVAGYWSQLGKKGITIYSPSGGGSLWPFQIVGAGSRLQFLTGAAGAYGATPANKVLEFQNNAIAFLGANPTKKTGWATPTGTKTRTTFSSDSVTLPELAARVAALIDDLHATAGYGLLNS